MKKVEYPGGEPVCGDVCDRGDRKYLSSGWDFVMSQDTVTQRAKFCAKVNSCEYRDRLNKYLPGAYFTLATYDMSEDTIDALDKTLGRNVFAFRTELLAIVNDLDAAYRAYACE